MPRATKTNDEGDAETWADDWLSAVADGTMTMSQRKLTTVEARGGLDAVAAVARRHGVHLAVLVDDHGNELVAASRHPIRVIC